MPLRVELGSEKWELRVNGQKRAVKIEAVLTKFSPDSQ